MIRTTAGDVALMHETCLEYLARRLSEGWRCIDFEYPFAVLLSPGGIRRELDLRNDVETLRPDAAGDECNIEHQTGAACPNHYQNVDEEPPDEDTTRVFEDSMGYNRDLYNCADHSVGSGAINKITVYARCRATSLPVGWASLKICIKSGTGAGVPDTVDESAEIELTSSSYLNYSNDWTTNPATAFAWTWDEIDNLQIGISMKQHGIEDYSNCTQVYVEVDYTLGVVPHKEIYVVKEAGVRQDLTSPTPDFEVISTGTRQDL